jgi:hypothetical protein
MAMQRGKISAEGKTAGPQQPNKYPTAVGSNYLQYGEQPGFVYDSYTDQYYKDKKAYEEYLYTTQQAERPKEAPGLFEQVAPVAALGGAYAVSQGIGEGLTKEGGFLSKAGDTLGGLLDLGSTGNTAATTTTGVGTAGQAAANTNTNLQGLQGLANEGTQSAFNAGATAASNSLAGPPAPTFGNGGVAGPLPQGATPQPNGTVTDASGTTIGTWAEGLGGAILFYQGYNQYKDGDKIGGGLGMAAGATYGASALGSTMAADAAPIVGGVYGAYNLGKLAANSGDLHKSDTGGATMQGASSGAALGASIGSIVPGVGTAFGGAVGGILGGLYGLGAGLSASGKGERQQIRDKYRDNIINNNIPLFNSDYKGDLADGTVFDFGKDKFGFGTGKGDFDLSNPTVGKAAAYGNVLAGMQGAGGKAREAIATQFLGASTANANNDLNVVKANYGHFLRKLGVNDANTAIKKLDEAKAAGTISDQEYQVFANDARELFQPAPNTPQNRPQPAPQGQAIPRPIANKDVAQKALENWK